MRQTTFNSSPPGRLRYATPRVAVGTTDHPGQGAGRCVRDHRARLSRAATLNVINDLDVNLDVEELDKR